MLLYSSACAGASKPGHLDKHQLISLGRAFGAFSANDHTNLHVAQAVQIVRRLASLLDLTGGAAGVPEAMATEVASAIAADERPSALAESTAQLKALLDEHHSDKATPHLYHPVYAAILMRAARRHAHVRTLEIGMGTNNTELPSTMGTMTHAGKWVTRPGASLRAFRDFLPRTARVHGADIDTKILFDEERIWTTKVDQLDPSSYGAMQREFVKRAGAATDGRAAARYEYDLIIDDGLHSFVANLNSLLYAWAHLRPGGFFVSEDIGPANTHGHNDVLRAWAVADALLRGRQHGARVETCMVRFDAGGQVRIYLVHKLPEPDAPGANASASSAQLLASACKSRDMRKD